MPLLAPTPELELDVPKGASAVSHTVVSFRDQTPIAHEDQLAVEEPLEIRLGGQEPRRHDADTGPRRGARRGPPPVGAGDRGVWRRRRDRPLRRPRGRSPDRERHQRPPEPPRRPGPRSASTGASSRPPPAGSAASPRWTRSTRISGPSRATSRSRWRPCTRSARARGGPDDLRADRWPPCRRAVRPERPAPGRAGRRGSPQRGRQGRRPHAAPGPPAARPAHPDGQRAGELRDHAEGRWWRGSPWWPPSRRRRAWRSSSRSPTG